MVHELAVGLGFVADGLPFGVVAEGLPVGGGGFTAGMLEDVDESFAFEGIVGGGPVGEAFHVVLVEEGDGVIAEAAEEIVELAFVDVVNAEFVDGRGGWHGVLFVRAWFIVADGPGGGGQQRDRGQGLQERAAVHHEILAEETSFQLVPPPRFAGVSLLGPLVRFCCYTSSETSRCKSLPSRTPFRASYRQLLACSESERE
jgi:hypothetical protein